MNPDNCALAAGLVSKSYIAQGQQSLATREKLIKALLSSRRLPAKGWDDITIELFLQQCACMDSNNFPGNVGVGEREARVASHIVAQRHFRLAHGIGRSGDVAAEQPKAAGSSLLAKLTNLLAADALRLAGLPKVGSLSVLPVATGMAITLVLMALRASLTPQHRYVLWPRIDQKTCLKAITAAGFEVVVVPMLLVGDELRTDVDRVERQLRELGAEHVAAVVSTSSCFAPRACDALDALAVLCARHGVAHIINNAYGVQAAQLCRQVSRACAKGRVDAFVQSTDKNFMVPVGGAIVAAPSAESGLVAAVNSMYPGRAAMAPLLDLLITLLHWGAEGWQHVLAQREEVYGYARQQLAVVADRLGERVLGSPSNPISLAVTLTNLNAAEPCIGHEQTPGDAETARTAAKAGACAAKAGSASKSTTFLGSMLFNRCVSGTRVVARDKQQSVAGIMFQGYGSHCDHYPADYLTLAAALGTSHADIDEFVRRFEASYNEFRAKILKNQK